MTLPDVLSNFRQDPAFMRCVTAWERIPARSARVAPWPAGLDPRLVAAAHDAGIEQPYGSIVYLLNGVGSINDKTDIRPALLVDHLFFSLETVLNTKVEFVQRD